MHITKSNSSYSPGHLSRDYCLISLTPDSALSRLKTRVRIPVGALSADAQPENQLLRLVLFFYSNCLGINKKNEVSLHLIERPNLCRLKWIILFPGKNPICMFDHLLLRNKISLIPKPGYRCGKPWASKIPCSLFASFEQLNNLDPNRFQFTGAFLIIVSYCETDGESYGSEKN